MASDDAMAVAKAAGVVVLDATVGVPIAAVAEDPAGDGAATLMVDAAGTALRALAARAAGAGRLLDWSEVDARISFDDLGGGLVVTVRGVSLPLGDGENRTRALVDHLAHRAARGRS